MATVAEGNSKAGNEASHESSKSVELKEYLGTISDELARFARRQFQNATMFAGHDERRSEERVPILVTVLAVPIDEENDPIEAPFEMLTRDVSDSALGLIHVEPMEHERLAAMFELNGKEHIFTAELIRREARGPFHGSALRFLDVLDEFPVPDYVLTELRSQNAEALSDESGSGDLDLSSLELLSSSGAINL